MTRLQKRSFLSLAAALTISSMTGVAAHGSAITVGDLVVTRVGDGSAALSSSAAAVNLVEYNTSGALQQTIPMPTTSGGGNNMFTAAGTSTEQFLTLSNDGNYLTLGGYNAAVGTATVANTAPSATSRVIGRVSVATGAVDTSTALTDTGTGTSNNIRSVASTDGSTFYVATATGLRYAAGFGAGTTTSTSLSTLNSRVAEIINLGSGNQLYNSSGSGTNTNKGVNVVSGGMPTTTGQTNTRLPGLNDTANASSWQYFFADANTLYITDDSTSASVGGLQKWIFDGTNWNEAYKIHTDTGGVNFGLRSLAGIDDGSGNAILYATTNETGSPTTTRLLTITDPIAQTTLPGTELFSTLAIAPVNTAFRGVAIVTPEPGSLTLLAGGTMLAGLRRRRVK